jgi:hypothetical protein
VHERHVRHARLHADDVRCQGVWLQTCNASLTGYQNEEQCETSALCNASQARCDAPVCDAGEHQCDGAELQECNAGRNGWALVDTCDSAGLCDAPNAECDECAAPAFACSTTNVLRECTATGHFMDVENCMDGTCDAEAGMCVPPP